MNAITPTPDSQAWAILEEAEATDTVKSMAEDRAACGGLPAPTAIPHYLWWIEDEAEIQEANLESLPEMYADVPPYLALLRELAERLRDLGFLPEAAPPDEAEAADLADEAEFWEDAEAEEVELTVAAYEWLCPRCSQYQRVIEVTETVTCVACGKTFSVADHHHAYG